MREIKEEELKQTKGGISAWAAIGIGALAAFLSGVIDGIARPFKCS